jgi:hypothetical protein
VTELPQVPRSAEILGPGLDELARVRPSAFGHANHGRGRWGDLFAGWEGQVTLLLRRLAAEVRSSRLPLATADALADLASSEYETHRAAAATQAVGEIVLGRGAAAVTGGAIPKGFQFRRDASTAALPAVPAAMYVATQDVSWPLGQATATIPFVATRAGSFANAPFVDGSNAGAGLPQLADVAFDPTITVVSYEAAGGSDGQNDDDLRRQASAFALGQYAPTSGAIIAGALRGTGVHRLAVRDVTSIEAASAQGTIRQAAAFTAVTIADVSWASSRLWLATVQQNIADSFLGHGCAVRVAGIKNTRIRCALTVIVRDPSSLSDPSAVTAAIQAALQSYFDDRPDWWTWKRAQIRAVVSRADARILVCSSVVVRALTTDTAIDEPTRPPAHAEGVTLTHWMLVSNGVSVTYRSPS